MSVSPAHTAHTASVSQQLTDYDTKWLQRLFELKAKLPTSQSVRQSNFSVLSIITYTPHSSDPYLTADKPFVHHQYGPSLQPGVAYAVGRNVETCFIGGSVCAERSALLQIAQVTQPTIHAVYLVSDAQSILTPGLLCREFLVEWLQPQTPIIMASANGSDFTHRTTTITELYPYPSLYLGVQRNDLLRYLRDFKNEKAEPIHERLIGGNTEVVQELNKEIQVIQKQILSADNNDYIHPLRLAAIVYDVSGNRRICASAQSKVEEYGYTIDPCIKLLDSLYLSSLTILSDHLVDVSNCILLVIDQFMNLHPPVASARTHLNEAGYDKLNVLLHDKDGHLVRTTIAGLCPDNIDLSDSLGHGQPT